MASSRRRKTLHPGIIRLFEAMNVKAWIDPQGRIQHNGPQEIRTLVGENIERARATGQRGTALLFAGVYLTAIELGYWGPEDDHLLDPLSLGNATYVLEKMKEVGTND